MQRRFAASNNAGKAVGVVLLSLLMMSTTVLTRAAEGSYVGSLFSADGGILGGGIWVDPLLLEASERPQWTPVTIQWTVSQNPDQSWHYDYVFSAYKGEASHFNVETSTSFTGEDIYNADGPFDSLELGLLEVGSENPLMPEAVHGIKFDGTSGTTINISFDSLRCPVWGDFYAKDGRAGGVLNVAWNAGFTADDDDPHGPAANGSLNNHILVPDTDIITPSEIVPEPSAVIFFASGLAGVVAFAARRRPRLR